MNDVVDTVGTGEVIREYLNDKPYASYLLLKFVNTRPVHVLVARNVHDGTCIVITRYEPDATLWDATFKDKIN